MFVGALHRGVSPAPGPSSGTPRDDNQRRLSPWARRGYWGDGVAAYVYRRPASWREPLPGPSSGTPRDDNQRRLSPWARRRYWGGGVAAYVFRRPTSWREPLPQVPRRGLLGTTIREDCRPGRGADTGEVGWQPMFFGALHRGVSPSPRSLVGDSSGRQSEKTVALGEAQILGRWGGSLCFSAPYIVA